jgi:hypothetical protein
MSAEMVDPLQAFGEAIVAVLVHAPEVIEQEAVREFSEQVGVPRCG